MTKHLVTAARRTLVADAGVVASLGSSETWDVWLFRYRNYVSVEGTGQVAAVISLQGGWSTPNRHNTMAFPQLQVEIFADTDRGPNLNPIDREAHTKALTAFEAIKNVLHVPQGTGPDAGLYWGSGAEQVRILNSSLQNEPNPEDVPGGDGLVRVVSRYAVVVG